MSILSVAFLLISCVASLSPNQIHASSRQFLPPETRLTHQEISNFINTIDTTWTAAPRTVSIPAFGVLPDAGKKKPGVENIKIPENIPVFFDARKEWPDCPSISEIRDQSNCGSCWAFATVEAITDRICIASKARIKVDISAQDLMTCCSDCGHGCRGGYPGSAWDYYVREGIVSGGLYNGTGCQPYSIEPHHHGENYTQTPECERNCVDDRKFTEDKHYGLRAYSLSGVQQIQADIMQNGPVGADFTIFSDFMTYKSGIYQRHSHHVMTGHAVKLIGWGEEAGVKYWLAANSWNTEWGESGFFRILRGSNECGIEAAVMAGIPDIG